MYEGGGALKTDFYLARILHIASKQHHLRANVILALVTHVSADNP